MNPALRARHPKEPWLWREDWAARRIMDEHRNSGWYLLFFALAWNAISWTITFGIWSGPPRRGFQHYFVLLFPAIGALMLMAAFQGLLRRRRYGVAVFELATLPAPLGRALAGRVRVDRGLEPDREMSVSLRSIRRTVTRSGKNSKVREETLWEDRRVIPGAIRADPGVVIPIAVAIPREATATDALVPSDQVLWRLEVKSEAPGVDFDARFEVPVFPTAESETPLTQEELNRLAP
jgi:hypothetical protein